MKNLQLNKELKKQLKELGFEQVNAADDYADFCFSLSGEKLVGLSIAKEIGLDHLVYWFTNDIEIHGQEMWDYLDEDEVEDMIRKLTLYKNWLKTFKAKLAEINETLNLGMEEI